MDMTRRDSLAGISGVTLLAGLPSCSKAHEPAAHVSPISETPILQTQYGPVKGYKSDGVAVFKGVRYGSDTRLTRFQKPAPPQPWEKVQMADKYGAACPQRGDVGPQSEDCLFLNVWTAGIADGGNRPIMVYFHGGAYAAGSGSDPLYDGANLVKQGDVVVITVNHRLNALGYLSLGLLNDDFPDSGNAGMWDLILALMWVRYNASAFGGDPSRIMVFGQSGGGAKIATLMAAPAAKGLFHSAATMSGQQVTASGPLNGKRRALAYLDELSIDPLNSEVLRKVSAEKLVDALSIADPVNPERRLYFGPVLDERLLKRHPFWPTAPEQSAEIPMILGNTKDETRNLIGRREPDSFSLDWERLPERLVRHMRADINPLMVIQKYRAIYPEDSATQIFFKATTASRSWRGQVEESDARARQGAPTWVYQMDLPSPEDNGKWGAPHTIDIAHAFNNLEGEGSLTGSGAAAQRVASQLSNAFIAFARTGNPNHAQLPNWARHSLPSRETMVFGRETRAVNDPRRAEREIFATVPFNQWGT